MNTEKIIQKLIDKAQEVKTVTLPEELVTEVPIEDFYALKTPIFYCNGVFYRQTQEGAPEWLKSSLKTSKKSESPQQETIISRINALEQWTKDYRAYTNKLIDGFNAHIEATTKAIATLKLEQLEIIKQFKEYVDNKTKEVKQ